MKSKKGFSSLSVQLTATVSVALVLLLLGLVATLGLTARRVTNDIKEHIGFDVVLTESASQTDVDSFKQLFADEPYVSSYLYHSPEEALEEWRNEMGEDLTELLDINPFLPEFEVNVKAGYAVPDSLDAIMLPLLQMPMVESVNGHTDVAESVNRNLSSIIMALLFAILALLPISLVLINNTVRLTIYARRFTIHTMKLVGASRGFIRRPFLLSNALQGFLAAIIASGLLAAVYSYVSGVDPSLGSLLTPQMFLIVSVALVIIGPLLCLLAAAWSTQHYLVRNYDDLF